MKKLLALFLLGCTLNPILISGYGHSGAGWGVGAGFLGLGLGLAIGSARNRSPEVIYVQQQAPKPVIDEETQNYEDPELEEDQELDQNQKTNGVMYEQV